jgi:hypothetical protein
MSALLSKSALRPDDIRMSMGRDDPDLGERVNRYFNACAASGLLQIEAPPSRSAADQPAHSNTRSFVGGLVSRLRHRLGLTQSIESDRGGPQ